MTKEGRPDTGSGARSILVQILNSAGVFARHFKVQNRVEPTSKSYQNLRKRRRSQKPRFH
jgi:hypothetical protein